MSRHTVEIHERLKKFRQTVQDAFDSSSWPTAEEEEWRRTDISVFDFDALAHPRAEMLNHTRVERKSKRFFSLHDAFSVLPDVEWRDSSKDELRDAQITESPPSDIIDRVFTELERLRDNPANRLVLWNLLLAEDIFVLHFPKGYNDTGSPPHELCWHSLGEDISRHFFLLVLADELSQSTVLLRLKGMEGHVQNVNAVYVLGREASLNVSVLQESTKEVLAFYQADSRLGASARFTHSEVILGGGFVKNRIEAELNGAGADLRLNGIFFANGEQHVDMRTIQRHIADHTDSRSFYKGVVKDEAETVFQGLIEVNKLAWGTDAYLTNNNLLLTEGAKADSIPSLNIETDDVKCSHGSTTGKLNEEQIYYCKCRGFSQREAEELLILGYFEELVTRLPEMVQNQVWTELYRCLSSEV